MGMKFFTRLGTINIEIKTGEWLYGRVSMEQRTSALEIWVCHSEGMETGSVTVQSSDHGLVGFNFNPTEGSAVGAYNNLHSLLFTRTKLYRAARLLLDDLERNPSKRSEHFLEGILLSILLKAPSAIRGALSWDPGELQLSIFGTHQGEDVFKNCYLTPSSPNVFEHWIFYNRLQDQLEFNQRSTAAMYRPAAQIQ